MEVTGTLDNYARALDPLYLQIFGKSFVFAGITTVVSLVLGFPVALAIVFAPPRWRALLLLLVILPFWTNLLIRTYRSEEHTSELQSLMRISYAVFWLKEKKAFNRQICTIYKNKIQLKLHANETNGTTDTEQHYKSA